MNAHNIINWTLSALITFILTRSVLDFVTSDSFSSIFPGWQTTIYSKETIITFLSLILLASTVIICILFRAINRCISSITARFIK
jgi:thiamine transporter ThiT